jgi:hypothetical protein
MLFAARVPLDDDLCGTVLRCEADLPKLACVTTFATLAK